MPLSYRFLHEATGEKNMRERMMSKSGFVADLLVRSYFSQVLLSCSAATFLVPLMQIRRLPLSRK